MKVYNNITELPLFDKAVLTIGTFDGVHKGHQLVIQQLLKEATKIGGTAVLITFFPHPKQIVSPSSEQQAADKTEVIRLLNTPEEKYQLLHHHGIEHIVVVPFDKAFASQPATAYVQDFLVKRFRPHTIIIGYDHRFGNNREGDYKLLEAEAARNNFLVKEIPQHILKDITVSSTKIRAALLKGELETATAYLGYDYFFSGLVIQGNQLGRTLGYPTANLFIDDEKKLVPANGVYAVQVQLQGRAQEFKGMLNIGVRPTVNGTKKVIEVNIFEFDEMIYGATIKITLIKFLRTEVKFEGLEALKTQLSKDKINSLKSF